MREESKFNLKGWTENGISSCSNLYEGSSNNK